MEWQDDGIIIGARRHGETSLILELMTRGHGRHLGLVKGGRSKRLQPLLQPGNQVRATWRARLEEHLGFYTIETTRLRAADLMGAALGLHAFNLVAALLRLLAEREAHESLFEATELVLDQLGTIDLVPGLLVRFEAAMLFETGFGLDLERCAATGSRENLIYVSPKSARAVSRGAGEAYRDKLLRLPAFLLDDVDDVPLDQVSAGFALTGFFIERNLYAPRGLPMPGARAAFLESLFRQGERSHASRERSAAGRD